MAEDNVPANIRPLQLKRDLPAIKRMWREVGWIDDEHSEAAVPGFFGSGSTLVATLNDEVECAVLAVPGTMRLQTTDVPLCVIAAVTTSRIARGQAFAQRLTARQLAAGAEGGAGVAALGMFDQGFYDKVGFATGSYEHQFIIDPASLRVDHRVPVPTRLGIDDYAAMHRAMAKRHKTHGAVVLDSPELLKADLGFVEDDFGLGFLTDGVLSHFIWLGAEGENGPYEVRLLCYQDGEQLLRLLGMLKSLADQVYAVEIAEPGELQLQMLLERPFRTRTVTDSSKFANEQATDAWWQFRILDVPICVAALTCANSLRFQLQLSDPVTTQLPADSAWQGVAGDYVVTLGPSSHAESGTDGSLPKLRCSIAAFSRLLWGIMPASSIALTEDLHAPVELLQQLDQAIVLPRAVTGWEF